MTKTIHRLGLMIEFDTWSNDYPRTMQVQWYRDTTLLDDQTYDVDNAMYFVDNQVQAYNKIILTFRNMLRPSRHLKIFNIYDGVTREFYNEEIENMQIIEEISSNNKALTIDQASTTIIPQNTSGVQFQRTLPFLIYRNEVLLGKFFINTSTSNTNETLYNLQTDDYIKILEGQTFLGGLYSNATASTIIASIMGDVPYQLDSNVGAITLSGYLPILNKREALRRVAFATNSIVDTSRSDKVVIKPIPTTISATIGKEKIVSIQKTQQNINTTYAVNVKTLSTTTEQASEIFSGNINGQYMVQFTAPTYDLSITGGTIVSSNLNYALISASGNVTLNGKEYLENEQQYVKSNPYAVSTDIEKVENFECTLYPSNVSDILNSLEFTEYKVRAKFKMEEVKLGDLVDFNGLHCRVLRLSYNPAQTDIYCVADMEAYYV